MNDEIWYPVGEPQYFCPICNDPLKIAPLSATYPNLVCRVCDQRAVDANGDEATHGRAYTEKLREQSDSPAEINHEAGRGDNPVFIDGYKCWRRYKGGFITRVDQFDCDSIREFRETHRPEPKE